MRARSRYELLARLTLAAPLGLLACSNLIGLGDLEKVDCAVGCDEARAGAAPGGAGTGTAPGVAGTGASLSGAGNTPQGGGGGVATGGSAATAGASSVSGGSAGSATAGTGGSGPVSTACPGGPVPALNWKEQWDEHNQELTSVHYDDCIAVYFDADTSMAAKDWLVPFLN